MTDLSEEIERLGPWYQSIELKRGVITPGKSDVASKFALLEPHIPADMTGMSVLDTGCNAGGIGIEFAKRGAEMVGVEASKLYYHQANFVRDVLNLPNATFQRMPIYEVFRLQQEFDIVLFLGLLYHLRYPQLAIDILSACCKKMIFVSTPILITHRPVMEHRIRRADTLENLKVIHHGHESRHNWWYPSKGVLVDMLTVAGFARVQVIYQTVKDFQSSSDFVDNDSPFEVGQVILKAEKVAKTYLPPSLKNNQ